MNQTEFCKMYDITDDQFYGKEKIEKNLDLDSIKEIPEGFNPIVGGFLSLDLVTEIPKGFNPIVGEDLNLSSLTEIPEGFNPIVGGHLYLESVKVIPKGLNLTIGGNLFLNSLTEIQEGFNPIVGGSLYLPLVKKIPKGFNPIIGENLYLNSLTEIPEGFNPIVGGSLYLSSLKEIPEGFKPIVGGSLNLNSVTEIPKGLNLTIGGYLDLSSLKKIPEGFNPIVGGHLYSPINFNYTKLGYNQIISWLDGKYIKVDRIFTEVVKQRDNVYHVKKLNDDKIFYLITDGKGKYSHGDTLKSAKESLKYKISSRDATRYKDLNLDSELLVGDMIECYRVITGACETGVKMFIEDKLNNKLKKSYTIREVIDLTKDSYNHNIFKDFFMK